MKNTKKEILDLIDENVAQDIVKKTSHVPNPTGKGLVPDVEKGDNARYVRHALMSLQLPPIDISDPKQVEERIYWYFGNCEENDMKPTVTGMANALGVDRKTLYDWSRGNLRNVTHTPIVKKAYQLLEELWEDYMQNGKINPVSGIFLGKNHFGYADKQEITIEPKNPLGEEVDAKEVQQRYLEEQKALELPQNTKTPTDEDL